jgi:hypothetical protein
LDLRGQKMNKRLLCSIYGSWCQRYCKYNSYLDNDPKVLACNFRNKCTQLKSTLESDVNVSADMTKRVLIDGIPTLFDRGSRHA